MFGRVEDDVSDGLPVIGIVLFMLWMLFIVSNVSGKFEQPLVVSADQCHYVDAAHYMQPCGD